MSNRIPEEPQTAPEHDKWYNLTLGSTFKEESTNRLCSLRYEFKPASIDKSRPGSMHKRKDNRVSVEFQNNQPGKPKVVFEGSSEDYKENEAVLIFDGESFRLERLHRSVKQLRHVRLPGDVTASASALAPTPESRLSPVIKPGKAQQYAKAIPPAVPVEVERIDVGEPAISGVKVTSGQANPPVNSSAPPEQTAVNEEPPSDKKWEDQDTLMEDLFGSDDTAAEKENAPNHKPDVPTEPLIPDQYDSDDEIADVDDDDDEATRGLSAAEALRAQVLGEAKAKSTSSSSSSSATSSSSSGSDSDSGSGSSGESEEGSDVNSI
uniref:Transcription elongation factor Eaf N-terminal domain-containing protein n=1 Tax=Kalanchoe fedtschenkoi TaxID=63787 RepID=A0A7N0V9I1_KALFE